ncbi:MAG: hypothetical protein E8D52_12545 [Nitrospira sp.]|nr:MAG: hypothetical protein E8D52_12545 [Nitrospira sp.]
MARLMAYHGASAAEHQRRFDELMPQGFRLTALTVSGDTSDARYAAVWDERQGPAWKAVHAVNAAQYQVAFDLAAREGFAPIIISATGSAGSEIFAAVFEQSHDSAWFAHHGMMWGDENTEGSFVNAQKRAKDQGFIPKSLCVYGNSADRRFAGIWHANTQKTAWSWWFVDPSSYQRVFDAQVGGHMRPGVLDVADDGMVLAVFQKDWVGAWSARHDIDAAEYQRDFDAHVAAGRFPLVLAAGGSGAGTRYAVLFSEERESVSLGNVCLDCTALSHMWLTLLPQTDGPTIPARSTNPLASHPDSGGWFYSKDRTVGFVLADGLYNVTVQSGTNSLVFFTVTDGFISYHPELEGIVEGAGTNRLVLKGLPVCIDTTEADNDLVYLPGVNSLDGNPLVNLAKTTFHGKLLPTSHGINQEWEYGFMIGSGVAGTFTFRLLLDGTITHGSVVVGSVTGWGTNSLKIKSFV